MLKVVIADDEVRVSRLLQALVEWQALDLELVGTAVNGLEALELIRLHHPDILITDIRMPGCYGIELIERAKTEFPDLEIVIVSGYAHFEYAQTAIRYGVGDYLLKPIQKEELNQTLQKLARRCRSRQAGREQKESAQVAERTLRQRLHQQLMQDLGSYTLYAPTAEQLRRDYCFEMKPGCLRVLIIKVDYDPAQVHEATLRMMYETLQKDFELLFSHICTAEAWGFHSQWAGALINYREADTEDIKICCQGLLNKLVVQKKLYPALSLTLALSPVITEPEQLGRCVEDGRKASRERLLEGTERVYERVPKGSSLPAMKLEDRYGHTIDGILERLDPAESDRAVEELQKTAMGVPGVCGSELLDLVRACGKQVILRAGKSAEQGEQLKAYEEACMRCSSAGALFRQLQQLQETYLQNLLNQQQSERQRPILVAKQYIAQHFSEPIALEEVAALTGFSASYFSGLFKRETGEGFAQYLIRVRMDRARELLQSTHLSVSEIGMQVGYQDTRYFTQTFKKSTNLTPGQYRKLYG